MDKVDKRLKSCEAVELQVLNAVAEILVAGVGDADRGACDGKRLLRPGTADRDVDGSARLATKKRDELARRQIGDRGAVNLDNDVSREKPCRLGGAGRGYFLDDMLGSAVFSVMPMPTYVFCVG